MAAPSIGVDYPAERRDRVRIILNAIRETLDLVNGVYRHSVKCDLDTYAIATTNAYFLLSNAYKRARLIDDNRTYDYKVAAMTAAAILEVKPIRFTTVPKADQDLVRFANWDCATRASISHVNVPLDQVDREFVRRFHRATLGNVFLPSLRAYLENFQKIAFINEKLGGLTFDEVEEAIPFGPYNNIVLRGAEMLQIERLINVYLLLKLSREKIAPHEQGD